jgi:hypothetical protein
MYELIISTSMTLPGASPPSVYYPPQVLMHFDDIGLTIDENGQSYYVDNAASPTMVPACVIVNPLLPCGSGTNPPPVNPTQVQSIHVTAQLAQSSGATNNVTAYLFLGDVSHAQVAPAQPVWFEVGQVSFISSATISGVIPASSSAQFVDARSGPSQQCFNICVRVYAISPSGATFTLNVGVSVVIQTWQQNSAVITLMNNSTTLVQLLDAHLSSANGLESYNLNPGAAPPAFCAASAYTSSPAALGCWITPGEVMQIQIPSSFVWSTGQDYAVSVVTSKGILISGTFLSP